MAKAVNAKVDDTVFLRLKLYSAATGQTIKSILNRLIDEKMPPLPREIEAPA